MGVDVNGRTSGYVGASYCHQSKRQIGVQEQTDRQTEKETETDRQIDREGEGELKVRKRQ